MRAFLKSLLKLSYLSVATGSVLFGLTLAGALALTYAMGETSCRDDKYNNTRTYLCEGAAKLGHPLARFYVATDHHFGQHAYEVDLGRAVSEYRFAARHGVTEAQINLAELLLSGERETADVIDGLSWIIEAAKTDDPTALYRLAKLLFSKEEGDSHFEASKNKQAIGLFKRAATKGHEPSQFALGLIYYFGAGAEEDEPLGIHWINEAYEAGYNPAAEFVDDFNKASRKTDEKSG